MDKKKVLKNSIWLSTAQIVGRVIGFIYFIFLARSLSVSNFGIFSWILGLGYNFYPVADFGIQRYVLKHLSRFPEKSKEYLSKLFPLRLLLAVISVLLSSLLALVLGSPFKAVLALLFGLSLLPFNLIFLFSAVKNAQEDMKVYSLLTVFSTLAYSLIGSIMVAFGLSLPWLLLSYFLGNTLVLVILMLKFSKLGLKTRWKWDVSFYHQIIKESWAFGLLQVLAVFYLRISLVLVGSLLGDYAAGIYGTASKFVEAGILFPQSIALAFFPSFSKLFIQNKKRLKRVYFKTIPLLALIGVLSAFAMWLIAPYLIPLVFGQSYLPAVPIFQLMGILMLFFFVNSLAGNIIQNSNRVKRFLPFRVLNLLVALIAGLVFIPRLGPIGGVWALIAGEVYGLFVNNYFVIKVLNNE